ncbi:YciI family protein [Stutzerimonas zhaodongensis]|uniref:YciI family protein n=1 Tax=Stutzerimonas zhaodongensis TaxID=1176257 RepID=A0A3M2HDQ9_9GAMM|nr:YciI family protein [Stutzerimonas zhaodongensis]MCQ4318063.1 YciI family protein [Stutzerimonas zhaodongensis]RMH87841.1 YciI family protein [Stutzerimonas zhaodongensis]
MRYLCLVYVDEYALACLPRGAQLALDAECGQYRDQLERSGRLIVGESLQPALSTSTLRVQDDAVLLRDGPVAAGREQPAAIYLFEAIDLNDAIQLASRIPPVRLGCAEVWPLRSRDPP